MTRGPFRLRTKDMTPEERVAWFRRHGELGQAQRARRGGRPKKLPPLSCIWRQAQRQDWGLGGDHGTS